MAAGAGTVVGIDVGYSAVRPTTGLCVLSWTPATVTWSCANANTAASHRRRTLRRLLGGQDQVDAVAVDGPLRPGLVYDPTSHRAAESLLSRGPFAARGKPGATNAGGGPRLHQEATTVVRDLVRPHLRDRPAAVVEAFPNLFLGVLCDDDAYPRPRHRRWTDALYETPAVAARLAGLLAALLPGRRVAGSWRVTDHDQRAALVCALTALCVAAGRFVAVGAKTDGFVVLPPVEHWAAPAGGVSWARRALDAHLPATRARFPACGVHEVDAAVSPHTEMPHRSFVAVPMR